MSGSILGLDQIDKLNQSYPVLVSHIRELLSKDKSPYGLMRVHFLVDGLDSDGIYQVFSKLPFLSPNEKKALVRAAIYEVLVTSPGSLVATVVAYSPAEVKSMTQEVPAIKEYTPPQFKLNVVRADALRGDVKDTPPQAPVVTNTAGTIEKPEGR